MSPQQVAPSLTSSPTNLPYFIIDIDDPRLYEPPPPWKPIIPWEELNLSLDRRTLVEELVAKGLNAKADGACTCGSFFRKILEYSDHWALVGRTTCHLMSCRNCGRGKMRAHRIFMRNVVAYSWMTSQDSRTIRLTIEHAEPCPDEAGYRLRIQADKKFLVKFRRRVRRHIGKGAGILSSVELDPRRRDSIFRLYYVGPELCGSWIRSQWQRIVGLGAASESKAYPAEKSPQALRYVLDSLTLFLMLPAKERARWEEAFQGFRLLSSWGSLRGIADREEDGKSDDPAAPYGRCPCGCGGVIEKSTYHAPLTMAQLSEQYRDLELGQLRYYRPSSTKVTMDARAAFLEEPWPAAQPRYGPS